MSILFTSILCWIGTFFVQSMKFVNADFFYVLKVFETLLFTTVPFLIFLHSLKRKSTPVGERWNLIGLWVIINGFPLFMGFLIGGTALACLIDPTFLEQMNW